MKSRVFKNYITPNSIHKQDKYVQFFVSDPTQLQLTDIQQLGTAITKILKNKQTEFIYIHSSYLISDLSKGYQKALLKQELSVCQLLRDSGYKVLSYIIHLHNQYLLDNIQTNSLISFENTSHRVNKSSYLKLLFNKQLVIDTSHLYCSGIADSADTILSVIKLLKSKSNIIAIHLNDQEAAFNSGKDIHKPIGQGRIFDYSPSSLDLFQYAVSNFDVILEYNDDQLQHVNIIQQFKSGHLLINKKILQQAVSMCKELAQRSQNEYQQQAYYQFGEGFLEISDKETDHPLNHSVWKLYNFTDKIKYIILYSIITNIQPVSEPSIPYLSIKSGLELFDTICNLTGLIPSKQIFIAGSIRRHKQRIGDIDIIIINNDQTIINNVLYKLGKPQQIGNIIYRFKYRGMDIDLYFVLPSQFVCTMMFLTGSKYFNIRMRKHAQQLGYKLTNHELYKKTKNGFKQIRVKSELDIFKLLRIPYIKPQFRVW